MKIQALNRKDFDVIDRAFCYFLGEQSLLMRRYLQEGDIKRAKPLLEAIQDAMTTYEKVQSEMWRYSGKNAKD